MSAEKGARDRCPRQVSEIIGEGVRKWCPRGVSQRGAQKGCPRQVYKFFRVGVDSERTPADSVLGHSTDEAYESDDQEKMSSRVMLTIQEIIQSFAQQAQTPLTRHKDIQSYLRRRCICFRTQWNYNCLRSQRLQPNRRGSKTECGVRHSRICV